jgi:hypothetical protein
MNFFLVKQFNSKKSKNFQNFFFRKICFLWSRYGAGTGTGTVTFSKVGTGTGTGTINFQKLEPEPEP